MQATTVDREFGSIAALVIQQGIELVCFDFGGTLFDLAPLHRRGFVEALGLGNAPRLAQAVEEIVDRELRRGADSFQIVSAIVSETHLVVDQPAVVEKKRLIIEAQLASATLDESVSLWLVRISTLASVAVLSLGLAASIVSVLQRSLGAPADKIVVYGRTQTTQHVVKRQLLESVPRDMGIVASRILFVGDAEIDEIVAHECGMASIRVGPFMCPS